MKETLATELLRELKYSARRWFIAFCVMIGIELITITGFFCYINKPEKKSDMYIQHLENIQEIIEVNLKPGKRGTKSNGKKIWTYN